SSAGQHGFRQQRGHVSGCNLQPLDLYLAGARSNDSSRELTTLQAESWGQRLDKDIGSGADTKLRSYQCSASTDVLQATEAPATAVPRLHTSQSHRYVGRKPMSPAMLHCPLPPLRSCSCWLRLADAAIRNSPYDTSRPLAWRVAT